MSSRLILLVLLLLVFCPLLLDANAYAKGRKHFSIEPQPLASALVAFADIAAVDYIAPGHLLKGWQTPPVTGHLLPTEALRQLLVGTDLTFSLTPEGVFLIGVKQQSDLANQQSAIIEEIQVTALKRPQFNQDVPLSVATVSGVNLSQAGKNNTRDLFKVVPSVSYHGAISSTGQSMRIRGIGTGIIAAGIEQSVGVIIDGVTTGPSGSGLQALWDIERIEVLKGPQGTLFGKNVSAGAINQITRDPTESFEWGLTGRFEPEYRRRRLDGFVSGPLSEHLQYRLAVFDLQQDEGEIYNVVREQHENTKNRRGIRAKLHYQPTDWWAHASVAFDQANERCCARVFSGIVAENTSALTGNWAIPALQNNAVVAGDGNRWSLTDGQLHEQTKTWHTVLELGKVLDSGHQLKSITGYRQWHNQSVNDADNIDSDVLSVITEDNELAIFSQELQLLSPIGEHGDYLLGAYYYRQHFPRRESIGEGLDFVGYAGNTVIESSTDIEQAALFAHVNYDITPGVTVFGGFRLLQETIRARGQQQGGAWLWPTHYPANAVNVDDTDYVGVIGLQRFLNNDSQLYLTVRRGYKGKAIDNPANGLFFRAPQALNNGGVLTVEDAVLQPETVILYEAGSKNYFFDHRVLFNGAVYYSEFSNFQAPAFDGLSSSFQLTNAGVIELRGVELELQLRPWSGAFLSGSLAWNEAIYKTFTGAPCRVGQTTDDGCIGGRQDLSGQEINENPKWQYALQYRQTVSVPKGSAYFNAQFAWRDDIIFDGDLDPRTLQKSFGLLDLRVGWNVSGYEVALFVNNATNEDYSDRIIDAPIWRGTYQRYPGEARTVGIELSIRSH